MNRFVLRILTLTLAISLGGRNSPAADEPDDAKPSITVFPVVSSPNPFPVDFAKRVGIVIATFLEKAGVEELEVVDTVFDPPNTDKINMIGETFGQQVANTSIKTDYAVFAQFLGTPQTGVKEIRTIVVDKSGKVILADSAGKAEFDQLQLRPKDPMTCCMFVSRRLQTLWKLEDPLRPNAPESKMARFWQQDAGIPDKHELNAIAKREETLKRKLPAATFTIYPVNVGQQSDNQSAVALVDMLNEKKLCKAEASEADPALRITKHSNEQKVLWDTARAFREFVKKHRPTTDYAVYADYGRLDQHVHYVHVIICDRSGDWVLLDMQNSHHPDFQQINPKSTDDCNLLLTTRLRHRLNE